MGRRGISYEKKLEAVKKYKRGEGSQDSIAREYGVDRTSFRNNYIYFFNYKRRQKKLNKLSPMNHRQLLENAA